MNLKDYLSLSPEYKLNSFLSSLSKTNRTPDYYTNWNKVQKGVENFEIELNTLNYLIGKENIKDEAKMLFTSQPSLLRAVPILIACRDINIDILKIIDNKLTFTSLDFENINHVDLDKYIDFMESTGLLEFLKSKANRSLVDYVYGVEVGLDSNARKNRSGTTMETIVDNHVDTLCKELNLVHVAQATPKYISTHYNINVPVDKSSRRFDEAIYDSKRNKLWLIETNYYGGGGSKLKAVSGEFQTLKNLIDTAEDDIEFIWITDGQGWHTASLPLGEAFENIDNIFNLEMLNKEFLKDLLK